MSKLTLATCSLAGCFGCHMSFLDMDERILELIEKVEFDRSPLTDIKTLHRCDIGLVEGGLCNEENVEVLQTFRKQCRILVAVGACAINGGIPAMRNHLDVTECFREAYLEGMGVEDAQIPDDEELPRLLKKVLPLHEAVKIDYSLPGCPPPADAFYQFLMSIATGQEPSLDYSIRHFD